MARPTARRSVLLSVVLLLWALLISALTVSAQTTATPLNVGENKIGEIADPNASALYTLTIGAPVSVNLQVLAITSGFVPRFRVLNAAGVEVVNAANSNGLATITGSVSFDGGTYTIEVTGVNGSIGQFVLSLQPGAVLPEPTTLTVDQPVTATVGSQAPVLRYRFDTTSQGALSVRVLSQSPGSGALVTVYDESTNRTIASSDAGVVGATYVLPAVEHVYRVEARPAGPGDTTFSIIIGPVVGTLISTPASASAAQAADSATATPSPQVEEASCTVKSNAGGSVNLRSGNGTQYRIVGALPSGQSYPVLGQNTGSGVWYQVNVNGTTGWVAASVTRLEGVCEALPVIAAPVNAQLAPTSPPVIQPTDASSTNPTTAAPSTNSTAVSPTKPTDVPTPKLPDLTVRSLRFSRDSNGNPILKIEIMNSGTASLIPQTFSIFGCFDGFNSCSEVRVTLPLLSPNIYTPYDVPLPEFDYLTQHILNVTLDGRSEISELDENNNTAYIPFG